MKPKWNIVKALMEDRASNGDQIQGASVERIEALIAGIKDARNLAATERVSVGDAIKFQFDLEAVLTRIRNRVGNFIVQIEHSTSADVSGTQAIDVITSTHQQKAVFLGHGRSNLWKDLRDFLAERLGLSWDEFNRESTAGRSNKERLEQMLDNACFAFLVMTAEDEYANKTMHARENVIHEIGLFQGRLGFSKAIILLEEGCAEFSNIHGLTQIRFPKGDILAKSEEIRRVLEREDILKVPQ